MNPLSTSDDFEVVVEELAHSLDLDVPEMLDCWTLDAFSDLLPAEERPA